VVREFGLKGPVLRGGNGADMMKKACVGFDGYDVFTG
jgi:hypothetical protein